MLTISQLASYAGVTVRTVRHYHQIGLLAEPERDHSGYRSYDAAAVVRLIRIRVLADAGVPLARVQELLVAGPDEFARAVEEIDKALSADIRRLQSNRKRIAKLAAGDHLALPQIVVDYLDRLRGLGVGEAYIELERDAWIMLAAQDSARHRLRGRREEPPAGRGPGHDPALSPPRLRVGLVAGRSASRRTRRHRRAPPHPRCPER